MGEKFYIKFFIFLITTLTLFLKTIKSYSLNDIIIVGEKNFRYVSFASTPKGEMFFLTSSDKNNNNRIFYGINKDGSGYFEDSKNNEKIFIYKKEVVMHFQIDSELGYIKLNTNLEKEDEYLMNFNNYYIEIYNYKNLSYDVSIAMTNFLLKLNDTFDTYIWSLNNKIENNINYLFMGFIYKQIIDNDETFLFYLYKIQFKLDESGNNLILDINAKISKPTYDRKIISCYITEKNYILCIFFYYYILEIGDKLFFHFYSIYSYDTNLELLGMEDLEIDDEKELCFFKSVYLREEIGCYIYYLSYNDLPSLRAIKYSRVNNISNFESYFTNTTLEKIESFNYNKNIKLNDLIRINNKTVCFTSVSKDKLSLIVVMIDILYYDIYSIRYYLIKIYELKKLKFYFETKIHLYNQFVTFGFSFCTSGDCNSNKDEYYSALMLFSYPNSTNIEFDLVDYLLNNTNENITINLTENAIIDNNIFGLEIYGVKIINLCESDLLSFFIKNNSIDLKNELIVLKDESIKIELNKDKFSEMECKIYFQIIAKEPDFNTLSSYADHTYTTTFFDLYLNKYPGLNLYFGKTSYIKLFINKKITNSNCDENCNVCLNEERDYCIICKSEKNSIINSSGKKLCFNVDLESDKNTLIIDSENIKESQNSINFLSENATEIVSQNYNNRETQNYSENTIKEEDIYDCSFEKILDNRCDDGIMKEDQIDEIYNYIKKEYLKDNYTQEISIITKNVIFQITYSDKLKIISKSDISSIDFGDCEIKLKKQYNISEEEPLVVFKSDIKSADSITTNTQYEIYKLNTQKNLNLSICNNTLIDIYSPVNLDPTTESLYNSLNNSGYNLFDANDSFYNDICTPYTTENGTDIIIEDRQNTIYNGNGNGNIELCQEECSFDSYDSSVKKAKCQCEVQDKKNSTINYSSVNRLRTSIAYSFLVVIENSNFMVMKCIKTVFKEKLYNNIGFILMTIILLITIILTAYDIFNVNKKINNFIDSILKGKISKKNSITKRKSNKEMTLKGNKNKLKLKTKKILKKVKSSKIGDKTKEPPKKDNIYNVKKKNTRIYINQKSKKNAIGNVNINSKENLFYKKFVNKESSLSNTSINKKNYNSENHKIFLNDKEEVNKKINYNPNSLTDNELNTLEYKKALKYDKRTFIEYYISLIKLKQIIVFTFFPLNDYNIITVKISLFLINFSLFFTIIAFFYDDNTMHNIYNNNGLSISNQIPEIIISSIIIIILNAILKQLALTEQSILFIKREKYNDAVERSKDSKKCFRIKFPIFYAINNIIIIFCWYFLSCFCAIYKNTQILLIRDASFSLGFYMLYPFLINLLPGALRISSLKDKNKKKECMYNISKFISLI